MLSRPIGLLQHGADGFESRIRRLSTGVSARGFGVRAKFPNVLPSTFITVNTGSELRNPSRTYGIGVVLE
jgi:hypothetical protein